MFIVVLLFVVVVVLFLGDLLEEVDEAGDDVGDEGHDVVKG